MRPRANYRRSQQISNIPAKANRILNVVLVAMLLIVFRIWHLSFVQYDEKLEESRKPQRRTVTEPSKRATIRDRFNIPLAINKMQYNVAIQYSLIKQIPTAAWETDPSTGKRVKRPRRKEYITALSNLLAKELQMDSDRIEDLIHAKASFYNQIPFVLKEDITERQYHRLKMLEKDWLGITVSHSPQRHYTQGKVGGDIIGYMGAINTSEYEAIIREMKAHDSYIAAVDNGEIAALPEGMESIEQVRRRLKDLQELSYTVNDSIGKAGIEARFEKSLRGFRGKRSFYSDSQGNFLRELPGTREPLPGKRILLTISTELQEFAEQLLIENEEIRITRLCHMDTTKQTIVADKTPWIKGGAIVAMDPNTGDIIAMASHPRIDPNDFIRSGNPDVAKARNSNINKWLENDAYLAEIWQQQRPLDRELYDNVQGIYNEEISLTWNTYLNFVLALNSPLRGSVVSNGTIKDAVAIQNSTEQLMALTPSIDAYTLFNILYASDTHHPHGKKLPAQQQETIQQSLANTNESVKQNKRILDRYLSNIDNTYDQILAIDLLRLAVRADSFSEPLIKAIGNQSLAVYKDVSGAMIQVQDAAKKMAKTLYHDIDFKEWRKNNEKDYLKLKREEEKISRRYAKPYIDYLDAKENEMFQNFWETNRWILLQAFVSGISPNPINLSSELSPYLQHFLTWNSEISRGAHRGVEWYNSYDKLKSAIAQLPADLAIEYMATARGFADLNRPLLGRYRPLRKTSGNIQQESHLATAFYPKFGFGFGRSQGYRQAATQGSIFKLVTAYEAIAQKYQSLQEEGKPLTDLNPLEITDSFQYKGKELILGFHSNGQPIPRFYKGGRLPKSATPNLGKMDVLRALETSSNPYFSLLAGDVLKRPSDLTLAAKKFSFGTRTGIDLPGEIAGRIPDDLETNRTGLYSTAIGQHTLIVTPLQTTLMLATIANGGKVLKPKIVDMMVGQEPLRGSELVAENQDFPYQDALKLVDIDFPLFIAADAQQQKSLVKPVATEIRQQIFLPDAIRRILLDGMCKVAAHTHNNSLTSLTRLYKKQPDAIRDFVELKGQLMGKTSTAESVESIDLDFNKGTNLYTHVWFGGIAYDRDVLDKTEHRFLFRNSFGTPELVVVIYLRYGGYGKEAAPLASQIAKKWREIRKQSPQIPLDTSHFE